MIVPDDWPRQGRKVSKRRRHYVIARGFHNAPAIVLPTRRAGCLKINFFVAVLTNVADVKIARQPVEGKAPWVAQPERPDFGEVIGIADKRIVGWHCVRRDASLNVDS